jgi:GNAT superfamily N-acetyltransferase
MAVPRVIIVTTPEGEGVVARRTRHASWSLVRDGVTVATAAAVCRPDRRWFVSVDAWQTEDTAPLVHAMIADLGPELHTRIAGTDADALELWSRFGFVPERREVEFVFSPDPSRTGLVDTAIPPELTLLSAAEADEVELRRLDDRLRNDAPGTGGWVNDPAEFGDLTFDEAHFDPSTHLVAVDTGRQRFAGLVRIWIGGNHARLGLIGVTPPYRRRGLARALLAHALHPVHERGITVVTAEVDATDRAGLALLRGLGSVETGSATVLRRT